MKNTNPRPQRNGGNILRQSGHWLAFNQIIKFTQFSSSMDKQANNSTCVTDNITQKLYCWMFLFYSIYKKICQKLDLQ